MSWLPFELGLALRYLRPKRTSVSFITLISVIGVMLGVAVLIVVISVMTGFHQQLQAKLFGFNSDLVVGQMGGHLGNYPVLMEKVREHERVRGVSPIIVKKVLVEPDEKRGRSPMDGLQLWGVDTNTIGEVNILPHSVGLGEFQLGETDSAEYLYQLVVGTNLIGSDSFGVRVGENLNIYTPGELQRMTQAAQNNDGGGVGILSEPYPVSGVYDVGYAPFNSQIVCSLQAAQELFKMEGEVTTLLVKLDDPHVAEQVALELQVQLGTNYILSTWRDSSQASLMLEAVAVEKALIEFLLFFIVIVAAFGITSSLIIFGVQKTRDIGLLKALGATNSQVSWVFLTQSMVVGVVGVGFGMGLGLAVVEYRNVILKFMREKTGFELFPQEVYGFPELPAQLVTSDIVVICGGSLLISIMAGVIPAWNASWLKPAEALRHE
jgi:lipoprotein-releasing system permease protein